MKSTCSLKKLPFYSCALLVMHQYTPLTVTGVKMLQTAALSHPLEAVGSYCTVSKCPKTESSSSRIKNTFSCKC